MYFCFGLLEVRGGDEDQGHLDELDRLEVVVDRQVRLEQGRNRREHEEEQEQVVVEGLQESAAQREGGSREEPHEDRAEDEDRRVSLADVADDRDQEQRQDKVDGSEQE